MPKETYYWLKVHEQYEDFGTLAEMENLEGDFTDFDTSGEIFTEIVPVRSDEELTLLESSFLNKITYAKEQLADIRKEREAKKKLLKFNP